MRTANFRPQGILPHVEAALALERRPRAEIDAVVTERRRALMVEAIPVSASGKRSFTTSRVPVEW